MEIPLLDLKRQYEGIKSEMDGAVLEVMKSQNFILGDRVKKLEENISRYTGAKHAVGVASGTDALLLSLKALGIGPKDKVITTPFTFFATAGAIHNLGATPVFVDIEHETYNIDPDKIEEALKKDVKAIIPVHLYGQMADMKPIMEIADDYGLYVIEDAAQAIGASYNGKQAGIFGDTGCFSFFPSKNLGGAGDGGMVTTNDDEIAEKLRVLRVHGSKSRYYHHVVGYNSRLDAIQASVLNVKLGYLDEWSDSRKLNADYYNRELAGIDELKTPFTPGDRRHVYNQYTVSTPKRDHLKKFLEDRGIGSAIYYPLPLHLQPCFFYLGYKKGDFPVADKASKEVLSLPVFPELLLEERDYIVKGIQEFFQD